ncbi:hypothetical protein J6590_028300 [Homalodisca vitripennis]|nr:hypothetical protein J6590_028300 [Homalodisca vitripennis]
MEAAEIGGYMLITSFSRVAQKLGGVAIYSKEELANSLQPIDISTLSQECVCEVAMVKVKAKSHPSNSGNVPTSSYPNNSTHRHIYRLCLLQNSRAGYKCTCNRYRSL